MQLDLVLSICMRAFIISIYGGWGEWVDRRVCGSGWGAGWLSGKEIWRREGGMLTEGGGSEWIGGCYGWVGGKEVWRRGGREGDGCWVDGQVEGNE